MQVREGMPPILRQGKQKIAALSQREWSAGLLPLVKDLWAVTTFLSHSPGAE
jgi:hypothetical protein